MKKSSSGSHPIVGIVASAGGLEAFKKFFSAMPADSGLAFVLVPHLDPSHESMMVDLLGKLTPMLVIEAKQGMAVLPNCIYIIPPNYFLSISQGMLQLSPLPEDRAWRTSMDYFLRSLAQDQGEQAIGIVLSGTGSHGSLGVREIKHSGGMVMAQKPDTAEYDQMPVYAIGTGVIDYVLPPEQMPAALLSYLKQPYLRHDSHEMGSVEQEFDLLNQILAVLQSLVKYDFRSYRKPMLHRRLQRRMGILQIDNLSQYLEFLRNHPEEATALCKDLLISVTAFFRDPEAYQVLEKEVLPTLIAKHNSNLPIRVWVAACASGEEAYSIAMLLIEAMDFAKLSIKIQIFASDIDLNAIEVARAGIYPASIAEDISPERLRKFFVMLDEHHYQIHKRVREIVVFSHQNLIGDAPFSNIDLISCRNLLIYLELKMQKDVLTLFHFALAAGGYLLLGPSESVGRSNDLFEPISKKWRLFRRLESVKRDVINIRFGKSPEPNQPSVSHSTFAPNHRGLREITEQLVLNEYAPAAALCNQSLEVLYVTGPLVDFLEFPRGELTKDILAMARPGLRTKLRATCRNAIRDRKTMVGKDIRIKRGGKYFRCTVMVRPLVDTKEVAGLLLVLFYESKPSHDADPIDGLATASIGDQTALEDDSQLAQQLEIELKSMSEELRSTIEEVQSSNEELKTSNEEIMSVNEEFQSVNEELETSKEELQSLNEELTTLNGQLQEKVKELKRSREDLMNLMSSSEIATVFLDENLHIKLFTPPMRSLLNLLSTDVGRPLKDIAPKFVDDSMLQECREVLKTDKPLEREIKTEDLKYYLRRILPYRKTDNNINGVVITFIDLTQRRNSEEVQRQTDARHFAEVFEGAERLRAIHNAVADAIITIDLQGNIESINRATEGLFQYPCEELIGKNIALLMPFLVSTDKDEDREASKTVADRLIRLVGGHLEVQAHRRDGSTFPVDLFLSRLDQLGLYMGILRDITLRKQLQTQILEIATSEQTRIGQELHDGTQQELTGLTLFAGAVNDILDKAIQKSGNDSVEWHLRNSDFQQIRQTLARLISGLIETNQHIHKLSHGIMPVQIDAEGLRSALAELAATMNTSKVTCTFDFHGSCIIRSNFVATQLYRIAQESVTNALKHGFSSDIRISLAQDSHQTILEISDNGIGFDMQENTGLSQGSGIGLPIMRYRANAIDGELRVGRNSKNGTTVRCIIPILGTTS